DGEVAAGGAVARREGAGEFTVKCLAGRVSEVGAVAGAGQQRQRVVVVRQVEVVQRQHGAVGGEREAAGGVVLPRRLPEGAVQGEVVPRQIADLHRLAEGYLVAQRPGGQHGVGRDGRRDHPGRARIGDEDGPFAIGQVDEVLVVEAGEQVRSPFAEEEV